MSEVAHSNGEESLIDTGSRADEFEQMRPLPRISVQAFCESEDVIATMNACAEDRRMARVHFRTVTGGIETATTMFASSPTPNLIILENLAPPHELMVQLGELAEVCDPSTKVVIVGHDNDVHLYRDLIRQGISEYIIAPVSLADMINVISAIFIDPDAEPLGRTLAFVGAKGGVGSSTVAHNCAWGISNLFSTEVILADLDLAFGTANINFDQDPPQGIAEAVFSPERLDDVFLDRLLAKCASHLSMLAAPSMLDRTYDFSAGTFEPVLEIVQRSAPVAVLDLPHIWAGWSQAVLKGSGRRRRHRDPGPCQSAQYQESDRHAEQDAAQRQAATPGAQPGRHAETAGDFDCRFLRAAGNRTERHHSLRRAALRNGIQQRPYDR